MLRNIKPIITLGLVLIIGMTQGCASVLIKPGKKAELPLRDPDYEESIPFFFFGLIGTKHLNVKKICFGRDAEQLVTEHTIIDLSIGAKTLFFYLPKTAKVWCQR